MIKKIIISGLLLLLLSTTKSFSNISFSSEGKEDYLLQMQVLNHEKAILQLVDENTDERIEVVKRTSLMNFNLKIRKEKGRVEFKIWSISEREPQRWLNAKISNASSTNQIAAGNEDGTIVSNLMLKSSSTLSINTSWGRIKYLFSEN